MELEDLVEGLLYWTVKRNDYSGPPVRPWRGVLGRYIPGGGILTLEEAGTKRRLCVKPEDLYLTEEAAGHQFIEESRAHMKSLTDQIAVCLNNMTSWYASYKVNAAAAKVIDIGSADKAAADLAAGLEAISIADAKAELDGDRA